MGITKFDVELLEKVLKLNPDARTVCELGSQNLYLVPSDKPPFASEWYEARGLKYNCIDMAGDNSAYQVDLSQAISFDPEFDIVTDFGTSEHVVQMDKITKVAFHDGHINSIYPDGVKDALLGYYNCWKNKHNLLANSGIMVNVNPKTGNWPGHGYHYITKKFYEELAYLCGYHIIELDEHPAMGNTTDGWNVYCLLQKQDDADFISFDRFCKLDICKS